MPKQLRHEVIVIYRPGKVNNSAIFVFFCFASNKVRTFVTPPRRGRARLFTAIIFFMKRTFLEATNTTLGTREEAKHSKIPEHAGRTKKRMELQLIPELCATQQI